MKRLYTNIVLLGLFGILFKLRMQHFFKGDGIGKKLIWVIQDGLYVTHYVVFGIS